ncbi:MAG: class I SAM-dependent methyltransferase [Bacteroidota bacterium]
MSNKDSSAKTLPHRLSRSSYLPTVDPVGYATLETLSQARHFNRWMASMVISWLKPGASLEIGAGIGNLSQLVLEASFPLTVSDVHTDYLRLLRQRFTQYAHFKGCHRLDIGSKDDTTGLQQDGQPFNNIFALNVIEHVEDDLQALANCHELLAPGGRAIILVPAFPWLYNVFDKHLGHFRRYTQKSLQKKMQSVGFRIIHSQYFNAIGILGWAFSGSLLRRPQIPASQMKGFDLMVPLFRKIDPLFQSWMGLSVCCIGEKLPS